MVHLKQHAFAIAFYILSMFIMINCQCEMAINSFDRATRTCPLTFTEIQRLSRLEAYSTNDIFCENIDITLDRLKYVPEFIKVFHISKSKVYSLEPFKNACVLNFSNITMNISNTHRLNEFEFNVLFIRSSNLTTFDLKPISSLKFLNLHDNALKSLNTTNFRDLRLDILNVSSNQLSNIYCENVAIDIDLSNNNLEIIDCKFAKTLKFLYLNNNQLSNFSRDVFKDMHDLSILNLSLNKLYEVANIFYDLEKLVLLHLNNNNIYRVQIGCFLNLKSLEYLDLSYNEIDSLPHGVFNGLNSLQFLDLSYNDIFKFNFEIFFSSSRLKELNLEGNYLKDFDLNVFKKETSLKKLSFTFADISCHKLKEYVAFFDIHLVEIKSGSHIYSDNINGIKCTTRNVAELFKSSFELSLNSLKKVHVTLTIIAICFLVLMVMFVFIQYYRNKK